MSSSIAMLLPVLLNLSAADRSEGGRRHLSLISVYRDAEKECYVFFFFDGKGVICIIFF